MRVLHLSDLHLTPPFRSLEEAWHGPAAVLKPGTFDFIVVSGDLSLRAEQGEFERLVAFLRKDLITYLVHKDPARLILVPGNHDVDWSTEIGAPLRLARAVEKQEALEQEIKAYQSRPEVSDLRLVLSRFAHLELMRIDPDQYPRRLHNVQECLDSFYGSSLARGDHRPFALESKDEGEHWSAHVFPFEKVAFYGFSSVAKNDRYWHGASLSPKAVYNARKHADKHVRGMLRVAVWHHGFMGDRGRPDFLQLQDLGLLHNAGFRVGFHGHTHSAAVETFDRLFQDRFVAVSTGSIGAGAAHRPDAVGNQFSIVRLYPGQVDVELYQRDGATGAYRTSEDRRRLYLFRPTDHRHEQPSRCGVHTRAWTVAPDGVARVAVTLTHLRLFGAVPLAAVPPPFWYVVQDGRAATPRGYLPVARDELPDGRVRFTLSGEHGLYKKVSWEYVIANAVALDMAETVQRDAHREWQPELKDGQDGRTYTVLFPCEKLTLSVTFDELRSGERAIAAMSVRAAVERRDDEGGEERWIRQPEEERRCVVRATARGAELSVEAPVVGWRYALVYKLARKGNPLPREAESVAQAVVERCRDALPTADAPATTLTRTVGGEVERLLGGALGREGTWQGFVWHQERRRLLATFGHFPNRSWAARFPSGWGVAGHAFRFGATSAWHSADATRRAAVHPSGMGAYATAAREYQWIVCAPVLCAPDGPAVGVVSFASTRTDGRAEETLRDFAEDFGRGLSRRREGEMDGKWEEFMTTLTRAVSRAFWAALAEAVWLSERRLAAAKGFARGFGGAT